MTTLVQPTLDGGVEPYPSNEPKPSKTRDGKWFLRRDRFTARELMAQEFPPVQEVARGVISCGMVLLIAAPKSGKSWLSLQLAYAAATGGSFLGALPCPRGRSASIAEPDAEARIR